jgi:hypothetical protein
MEKGGSQHHHNNIIENEKQGSGDELREFELEVGKTTKHDKRSTSPDRTFVEKGVSR